MRVHILRLFFIRIQHLMFCRMPVHYLGKRRESLTTSTELYKKHIVSFLKQRGFHLLVDSGVEGSFADCIFKYFDGREYWAEIKADEISLNDMKLRKQLVKYLCEYIRRTPKNRFSFILAAYNIKENITFKEIFEEFKWDSILSLIESTRDGTEDPGLYKMLIDNSHDVVQFFEESLIYLGDLDYVEKAEEKITSEKPKKESIDDSDYTKSLLSNYGEVELINGKSDVYLNAIPLKIPDKIYVAQTVVKISNDAIKKLFKKEVPLYLLKKYSNGDYIYCFSQYNGENVLTKLIAPNTIEEKLINEEDESKEIIIEILNLWIKSKFSQYKLEFDDRTGAYYFPKLPNDSKPITKRWSAKRVRRSRIVSKPYLKGDKINFWSHRSVIAFCRYMWNGYYLIIRPRWLFSSDGTHLLEGSKAALLDAKFRKSQYSRNKNQWYDMLFWYNTIFMEKDRKGTVKIDKYLVSKKSACIEVLDPVHIEIDKQPNVDETDNEDDDVADDEITLDDFGGQS